MPKVTAKHWPWAVTLFLTCLLWMHTCNLKKIIREKENTITQIDLDRQQIRELSNRQGKQILAQDVLITNSKSALNRLTDTIFNLRAKDARNLETIAYYKGVTRTDIREVRVPYLDSGLAHKYRDSLNVSKTELLAYITDSTTRVPRVALVNDRHFQLGLTVQRDEVNIDSLKIPDTLQLRFVEKGGNWFKSPKIEVQYFHSNPYVQTLSSNSAFYQPKKKSFWTTVVLPVAIGVGAGLLISK